MADRRFRSRLLGGAALAAAIALPAAAQDQPPVLGDPNPPADTASGPAVTYDEGRPLREGVSVAITRQTDPAAIRNAPDVGGGVVDERRLYYFASRYDYEQIDQEIRRLKAIDPDWTVPADLFSRDASAIAQAPQVDERPLWALWNARDIDGVQREIAVLRQVHPGWEPPADLVRLIAEVQIAEDMRQAMENANHQAVIDLFDRRPGAFTCQRVDYLWALADALYARGETAATYTVYRRILDECDDTGNRLSTLQKALANREDELLPALFAIEAERPRTPAQETRWQEIVRDWRGDPNDRTPEGRLGALLATLESDPDPDLAAIEDLTRDLEDPNAAQALGWYYYDEERYDDALEWFQTSMNWERGPQAAEGLAYTYQALGQTAEARRWAREWVDDVPALQALIPTGGGGPARPSIGTQVTSAYESGNYGRVLSLTETTDNANLLVLRGWSLVNLRRPAEAQRTFERAIDLATTSSTRSDAAFGLAQTLVARGQADRAAEVLGRYDQPVERRRQLTAQIMERRARDAFDQGDYRTALGIARTTDLTNPGMENLAYIEAWSLYQMGEYRMAKDRFERLYRLYATPEAAQGLSLAEGRLNAWRND
ncbi:MAG: tetratricopeptide repeat protein [Alphaproteobacteria bacterium]|jgi:tetratricopeptide (TPR) repeat protein|nr:tetratricopeptide repeat protein [Alphaproteobacteria bacterium]